MSCAELFAPFIAAFERRLELGDCVTRDIRLGELGEPPLHRVEIADDDGQEIVEVVGNAAAELPHGFHLDCLPQRRLCLVPQLGFRFKLTRALEQPGNGLPRRHRENAGKDHRREQSKTDEGCEPYPQSFRLLLPRRQQPLFLPVELLHLDA